MKETPMNKTFSLLASLAMLMLSACANFDATNNLKHQAANDLSAHRTVSEQKQPVVTSSSGMWLLGPLLKVPEPPNPVLQRRYTYHPTQVVSLSEVAAWITQSVGISVDISELQVQPGTAMQTGMPVINSGQQYGRQQQYANHESLWAMRINYEGTLAGLLDVAANKAGAWWRWENGQVVFYRTRSKTFYLAALAEKFNANSSISTSSESSGSGNSSGSGITGQASLSSVGGITANSTYTVDFWADVQKTATSVAGSAQVAVSPSARSITVTGSPAQVAQVADWVKNLNDLLSQQVEITVRTFRVKVEHADNYNWNPSVIFKSASSVLGATLSGAQAPAIASGMTAANLGLDISGTGNFTGSTAALQALSTLGEVVEIDKQTAVTLNGQPILLQTANTQSYIASSSSIITANVGTQTMMQQDSVTAGTTWVFLPQITNGKVVLGMNLTRSVNNGFKTFTSGDTTVQTKNVDSDSTKQSVSLTPGDALLLSMLTQDTGSINKSGVVSPNNPVFGGGFANTRGQVLTGIVITVRIL
jgi:type IVB pilus formation R64 PilN family outer membrane protein